jgi:hypothetical protein
MRLTTLESRLAHAALEAFAPRLPSLRASIDYAGVLGQMMRNSTRKAAFGMRLALWVVALAPLWLGGKLCTFASLSLERRTRMITRLMAHKIYVVRELMQLLKMTAAMALLSNDHVRRRSRYDLPPRFGLPVVESA